MPKKLTTDEFIKKANQIHNNYYSYEQTNYVDTNIMVDITCPVHGVYKQKPKKHYFGWKGHRDTLESIRFRDNIKTNYCKTKGINLLRIPYTKFDEIEIILSSFIKGLA
jgi:hypothetical protein